MVKLHRKYPSLGTEKNSQILIVPVLENYLNDSTLRKRMLVNSDTGAIFYASCKQAKNC